MSDPRETGGEAPSRLVLVVDDYDSGREITAEYFKFSGYRVATAEDGEEALAKAFELRPDVILMDLSLPKLSGWEATERLRADERTRDTPLIVLTAHTRGEERDRATAAGCDSIVTKPVVPSELVKEVERLLARRG